jgi:hypothetical protein
MVSPRLARVARKSTNRENDCISVKGPARGEEDEEGKQRLTRGTWMIKYLDGHPW